MKAFYTIPALLLLVAGCSGVETPSAPADIKAIEAAAHGGYVTAINSNNVDTLMEGLTDDVVFQAQGAPEVIGKAAVRRRESMASSYTFARTSAIYEPRIRAAM